MYDIITEKVFRNFQFYSWKQSWYTERDLKTELVTGKAASFVSFYSSSHKFLQRREFNKLLPDVLWILTNETCLPASNSMCSSAHLKQNSLSSLMPHSKYSGTKLCIYHFKAILKWVAYTITLEALTVVLFKPDKDIQLSGLRREPSKLSSTNSAMTE